MDVPGEGVVQSAVASIYEQVFAFKRLSHWSTWRASFETQMDWGT